MKMLLLSARYWKEGLRFRVGGGILEGVEMSGMFSIAVLREEENEGKKRWRSGFLKQNFQNCVERRLKLTEENQV